MGGAARAHLLDTTRLVMDTIGMGRFFLYNWI